MSLFRRIFNLFRRSAVDREIDDELQAHIQMRIDDNIARGMSSTDARRDALLRFGNRTVQRERVTAVDVSLSLESLSRDLRYAARQLRHSPGFALTAIVTLAFGIGANVIVFGVFNAMLLRPLDIPVSDRLVEIVQKQMRNDNQSYPDYLDFRRRNSAFTDLAAYRFADVGLSAGGTALKCWEFEVSSNYFDMLGVQPALGRFFHDSDEHGPNSAPYLVLSDSFWRTHFNADPRVIGTRVDLNKHPFTIIGVAPKSFHGTELFFWPEFWSPMVNEQQIEGYDFLSKRFNHGIFVLGALRPGVTTQQAADNLNTIAGQLAHENPQADDGLGARLIKPGLLGDVLGGPMRPFLSGILVLALLVLIAAWVNLAGIFSARASDRARELAIRVAIGSSRWRILRQLLTEACLISVTGGLAGTAVATAMMGVLTRWQPIAEFPVHVSVSPDIRVFVVAIGLSIVSGILPGLMPARQVWRTDAIQTIKGASSAAGLFRRLTLRDVLLAVQVTLCALLVTSSLVALRGMERSLHAPLGLDPQNALVVTADLHMAGYTDQTALPVQRRLIERAARLPGVTAVGMIDDAPLSGAGSNTPVYREGTTDLRQSNAVTDAHYFTITPGYLRAAATRLLTGRDFTWDDGPNSPKVVIVNQRFAHIVFGSNSAIGRHFLGGDKTSYEIVGVVEDGKYDNLTEDPGAAMFFPFPQNPEGDTTLIVRTAADPADVAPALNHAVHEIEPSLPFSLSTWPDALSLVLFPSRVATASLGVMGALAALLAITGVFGMSAYSVSRRLRELGIRIAMGAQRGELVLSALGRPLKLLVSGSALGLLLGVLGGRLLSYIVYHANPGDPVVLGGAALAMTLLGLIATWIPARRALRVNPAQLLRED